jgi:hypothetical protein
MNTRTTARAAAILASTFLAAPLLAADDAATRKDLFTVITLQGLPCGEVVAVVTRAANDHVATCRDGHRYRVYLNAEGRVVVEPQ